MVENRQRWRGRGARNINRSRDIEWWVCSCTFPCNNTITLFLLHAFNIVSNAIATNLVCIWPRKHTGISIVFLWTIRVRVEDIVITRKINITETTHRTAEHDEQYNGIPSQTFFAILSTHRTNYIYIYMYMWYIYVCRLCKLSHQFLLRINVLSSAKKIIINDAPQRVARSSMIELRSRTDLRREKSLKPNLISCHFILASAYHCGYLLLQYYETLYSNISLYLIYYLL